MARCPDRLTAPSVAKGDLGGASAYATIMVGAMNFGAAFWFTAMQEHVPPHARSRVSSYDWLGSWLCVPLGYLLVGPVAESIGYDVTLLLAVAWTVVSSLATSRSRASGTFGAQPA